MNSHLPNRILMTADTVGGVWTYALELAAALGGHGIEVLLATMGSPVSRDQWREARLIPNLHLFESRFRLEWMDDPWLDVLAAGDWLLELEQRYKPELIHLNGYAHGALPWQAPTIVVGHSCVLSWWKAVRGEEAPSDWDEYRENISAGLEAADLVVTPSRAMLDCLREQYGAVANALVIPNGRALRSNGRCKKERLILAAGRLWDEAKNIGRLAGIASDLEWPVLIAGETICPNEAGERKKICDGGVGVPKFLGKLSSRELWGYFARASIYVLPALYEPFGLTPLEAALSGCALVLGDIDSLREIWGDAAVFIAPDDPRILKAALEGLIANPRLLREMTRKAQLIARSYTPEKMANGYLAAYANVLGSCPDDLAERPLHQRLQESALCES